MHEDHVGAWEISRQPGDYSKEAIVNSHIRIGLAPVTTVLLLLITGCARTTPSLSPSVASAARVDTTPINVREGTKLAFDLSPDAHWIVFDVLGQLWLLPIDGGEARPLTDAVRDTADDQDPAFSPDGKWIVFRSDRPGGPGLWMVSADGRELRRLTDAPNLVEDDQMPVWSPNGDRIALVRFKWPAGGLWIIDRESRELAEVKIEGLPDSGVREIDWSPDGRRFVLTSGPRWKIAEPEGQVWEVDVDGGIATPLLGPEFKANSPAYSPDGDRIALFARDSADRVQLYVWSRGAGGPQRLTDHLDTTPLRVRWAPDGATLFYSADGKLWRISAAGGAPTEIPFTARMSIVTRRVELPPARLAAPGTERPVRGHHGLAVSPDGNRVAWIALGKLWIFELRSTAIPIADIPLDAVGLAWSPDGRDIAWSAGPLGATNLFAVNTRTGETRRLTDLPGETEKPSWSPDGRRIAFVHAHGTGQERQVRLRLIPADTLVVNDTAATIDLGDAAGYPLQPYGNNREVPQWAPDGRSVLLVSGLFFAPRLIPIEGPPLMLTGFRRSASNVRWRADGSLVYIEENALWRARFDTATGEFHSQIELTADPAAEASVTHDGSILYVSTDGLRVLRSDSTVDTHGWPLRYRVAPAPPSMLIRNVRVIGIRGERVFGLHDIRIDDGRIARIAAARTLQAPATVRVIEGGGKTVIPGLIDLHVHLVDDAQLPLMLASGITTIRDVGSRITQTSARREAVEAGVHPGPRIVFGGSQFYPFAFVSGVTDDYRQEPRSDAGLASGIALARAFGADYVKLRLPPDGHTGAKVVHEAHARGMPVSGHLALPRALIAAGVDGMEHLGASGVRTDEIVYDDVVQVFRAAKLWIVPTIVAYSSHDWLMADPGLLDDTARASELSPWLRRSAVRFRQRGEIAFWNRSARSARLSTGILHRAGVTIAAGGDVTPIPWALHWELEELVAAGLSPLEAIAAATATAAEVLGLSRELGTIEVGRRADLLILDANPLDDIGNTRRIWRVIQGGRVVDREALLRVNHRRSQ